jgi:hypothetical protein
MHAATCYMLPPHSSDTIGVGLAEFNFTQLRLASGLGKRPSRTSTESACRSVTSVVIATHAVLQVVCSKEKQCSEPAVLRWGIEALSLLKIRGHGTQYGTLTPVEFAGCEKLPAPGKCYTIHQRTTIQILQFHRNICGSLETPRSCPILTENSFATKVGLSEVMACQEVLIIRHSGHTRESRNLILCCNSYCIVL